MTTVFISYSRRDDELFAKRLYNDLTQEGLEVWWDRESLHSVSLSFHQQIKDAIRAKIDRLIYIAGPNAVISDYVREEWKFALECDKPVIPILCMGDYDSVPGELSLLHCDDFRDITNYPDQLKKLIANLRRPEPALGHLFAVPTLPKHFMGRTAFLRRLKDAVQVDLQKPVVITGAASRVGVQGMGGIGKSVLATAVARDREVRRAYPDGIIWVSYGQTPDIPQCMRNVAKHLGNSGAFENVVQGQGVLRKLLLNKAVLIVFDDVWNAKDVQAFDVLGPRCRAMVTTRDAGILHVLHGELYSVELFTEDEALSLLAASVKQTSDQLPQKAREIVRECGCLPLAVALCGGMVKKRDGNWESILKRLQQADLEKIADRHSINDQHKNIWRAMQISVESLEPDEQKRFAELSVFVTDQTISRSAVGTLWAHTGDLDNLDTEDLLINLSERSLIRIEKGSSSSKIKDAWQVSLHDLLYDYTLRISGDKTKLNNNLLTAYSKKCAKGWPSGPDDGYFFQNLCSHLIKADQLDDVVSLLINIPWIEAKCRYGLVFDLQNDYKNFIEVLPDANEELMQKRQHEARVARWTNGIIEYAKKWSDRRKRIELGEPVIEPEPEMPEIIPSVTPWSEELIKAECERIIKNPTRLDLLRAFYGFVQSECYPLLEFGERLGFVVQHAYNRLPGDPLRDAASGLLEPVSSPLLLRRWAESARYNPKPALMKTLEGHSKGVKSIRVTPDGKLAVSASEDGTLRVWELASGQCFKTLESHSDDVESVSVTPDGKHAVSASLDRTLKVWDLSSGECLKTLEGHSRGVKSVSITPDGKCAVSASLGGTLRVWDLESGQCLKTMGGHSNHVISVSVTPDGKRAVTASWDKTLRVWDLTSGQCLKTMEGHSEGVGSVSVTPDGKRAVSASWDKTVRVWDLVSGQCVKVLEGLSGGVMGVSVTPDGKCAVSANWDKTLRVWDLASGQCLKTLEGHSGMVLSVSVTPDGKRAVSASWDKTVRVWDLASGQCLKTLESHSDDVESISVTPDGKRAVTASGDTTLRVWDLTSGQCLRTMEGHGNHVKSVSVTPDGKRAVSASEDWTLRVWDLATGQCLKILESGWGHSVIVTPNGKSVVSSSFDPALRVWDLESGQCLKTMGGHSNHVISVSVTPDGKRAVSAKYDENALRVWDMASGQCLKTMEGHSEGVGSVSVTPDGKRAVSASLDKTLRVWDLASGRCLKILEGHSDFVTSVSVTHDGKHAVSACEDKTLRIWDLASGQCLALDRGNAEWFAEDYSLIFNRIIGGSNTGEVAFFDLSGLITGRAFCTASRNIDDGASFAYRCPCCGEVSSVPEPMAELIESHMGSLAPSQSPCFDLPNSAFTDARLQMSCPNCNRHVRLNPFYVDMDI